MKTNALEVKFLALWLFFACNLFPLLASPLLAGQSAGPDIIVFDLSGTQNFGASGGIIGYAFGARACNTGDEPVNMCDELKGCGGGTTNKEHPVVAQNMYRIRNGRFEQIGASWLRHSFLSVNSSTSGCGDGSCDQPPLGSNQLGVGCTNPAGATLNGERPLGRRSEVNATTGDFPFPFSLGGSTAEVWNQRVAVAEVDLDPALNPGASYYIEGQYIAADDALSGNGLNNSSFRSVTVASGTFNLIMTGATVKEKSAIEAWAQLDPAVEIINLDVPSIPVQRFHVARKVTSAGGGLWHYEYAIHNMNSDRAADRLTIEFVGPTAFSNVFFHDINSHSNEIYDTSDWENSVNGTSISWTATSYIPPENANALRWATVYSFGFDATRTPTDVAVHKLRLFTTGNPAELEFVAISQEEPIFADGFESGNTNAWL